MENGTSNIESPTSDALSQNNASSCFGNNSALPIPSYKMDHPKRGYFVIFNQHTFKDEKLSKRDGTMIDESSLAGMAEFLGFEKENIKRHKDLTRLEILDKIRDYANEDHKEHDCFVCAVLTHGQRLTTEGSTSSASNLTKFSKEILYAHDEEFELNDLKKYFDADKCPSLAGKPKLFFVQACRGTNLDYGVFLPETTFSDETGTVGFVVCDTVDGPPEKRQKIPIEADFFFGYCTVPGYYAWRNSSNGSHYITAMCELLRKYGKSHNFEQIMTLVNHTIATQFESATGEKETSNKKQMPAFTSQLTKRLCFTSRTEAE